MSVLPAAGPAWGCPQSTLHVSMCGMCRPPGAVQGGGEAGPAPGQSTTRSCPRRGVVCVRGGKSQLTSVVLSCRFSGVRTDEAWPVFTLCVFPCLFLFPPHLHRTLPSNKKNFHLSDQREGWSFSLLIHLQYTTSRWDFSSRERRAIPKRGVGSRECLPSRHGHGVPNEICLLFAVTLVMALILCFACLCCSRAKVHKMYFACEEQPGWLCSKAGWEDVHVCGVLL